MSNPIARRRRQPVSGKLIACGLFGAAFGVVLGVAGCGGNSSGMRPTGGTGGLAAAGGGGPGAGGLSGGGSGGRSGGSGGAGGTGGSSASGGQLVCNPGVSPAMPLLSDFSPGTWMNTFGKWGVLGNLMGSIYPYAGTKAGTAGNVASVSLPNENLVLSGNVGAGDYAGGGMSFDQCVHTTAYTGVQFTLGGTVAGCDLYLQVQTFSQQSKSNKGGCDTSVAGTSCYSFPKVKLTFAPGPVTVRFAELAGGMPTDPAAIAAEIVGLQWQFQSGPPPDGGVQMGCTGVSMTIDDVRFVSN